VARTPDAPTDRGPSAERIRILLGEDSFLVREGIANVIGELPGIELVASCGDLDALREAIDRTGPDVVLTDIRMPPDFSDEGIRLAAELRTTHPRVGVVVLSQHAEPQYAAALFADGAARRGYLLKDQVADRFELGRAIRAVAAGGSLMDPRIVELLLAARQSPSRMTVATLTDREREVLVLIAAAHSNQAIATQLGITTRGVERHINSIFAKLGLAQPADVSPRVKAALIFLASEGRLTGDEGP
jgi:DNA-binding NarL/FixJ family response regulator